MQTDNYPNILKNIVYCTNCQEAIESKYRWDYVTCKCGRVSVDGGKDYLKRGWIEPLCWIEMSLFADDNQAEKERYPL